MNKVNSLRRFSSNVGSQFGEDGILQRIFEILPGTNKWCVEFGAWDGKHLSNCYNLISNSNWKGVMIEANGDKFLELKKNHGKNPNAYLINRFVEFTGENTLDNILK